MSEKQKETQTESRKQAAFCIPDDRKEGIVYMNEWYESAIKKLKKEKKEGAYSRHAGVMKEAVSHALETFCKDDAEFAQAVVQSKGTFSDCMKVVAQGCGSCLSDLEAYSRAVCFYFPGATVKFQMRVDLCGSVDTEENNPAEQPAAPSAEVPVQPMILSLDDFL